MSAATPYDVNFCFPAPEVLENDRVKLVPFTPSLHLNSYFTASKPYPEIYKYIPWGDFPDVESFGEAIDKLRQDPGWLLFAVFDKTTPSPDGNSSSGAIAGLMGYLNSSVANLCTEIGAVIVLPPFQRTHVASNSVGLLINYALNLPSDPSLPGLGLRRVVWQANYLNQGSVRLAQRMGFQKEAILRWDRVLPLGKPLETGNGKPGREGDPRAGCLGRDTIVLSLCWDDWENGGRPKVEAEMARQK